MKHLLAALLIVAAACDPDPVIIGADCELGHDCTDAGTDAQAHDLDAAQGDEDTGPPVTLLNATPRPKPDAGAGLVDAGTVPDGAMVDAGPVPTLDTCEPCETDAECLPGLVCVVSNNTGTGTGTRCLPVCTPGTTDEIEAQQESQCGFFGNFDDPPNVKDRAWLCYSHGACGPIDSYCAGRFVWFGRLSCVDEDYCDGWLP